MDDIALGIVWYAALLFSLTFHEAAHAWAAQRGGDPTAYHGGQVSLDPRPHLRREPLGTVFVPLLSYAMAGWMIGWASTPYDPHWADRHPRRAAWMSLAGPLANLAIVVFAGLAIRAGMAVGALAPPGTLHFSQIVAAPAGGVWEAAALALSILFALNLLLFVFNLIPLPPLDGAGAIGLLVSDQAARRYRARLADPRFAGLGLLAAWLVIRQLYWPALSLAVALLYPEVTYR
jgi:Zn-dependent protease